LCPSNDQRGISLLRRMTVVIYMANIAVKLCSTTATQGAVILQRSGHPVHLVTKTIRIQTCTTLTSRQILKALDIVTVLAGSEVLPAVVMKSSIFWYITPCSPLKVNRRFGRCHFNLQGPISQARNQHETGSKQSLSDMFL
jgi:hypothetical protein